MFQHKFFFFLFRLHRLMWAAQLKAPLLTQCALNFLGTSGPRGTFWYLCVPVDLSLPRFAPQNFTLLAFISLVLLRAGGGRSFTLASFASVGKHHMCPTQELDKIKQFLKSQCHNCF